MKSWDVHDAVEWLLQRCRDKKRADPKSPAVTVDLTAVGSDSEPPGKLLREAIEWARGEAIECSPSGWVRIHGAGDPGTDNTVSLYSTPAGEHVLQRRENYKEASPGTEA